MPWILGWSANLFAASPLFGLEVGEESSVTSIMVGDLGTSTRLALILWLCFIVILGGILHFGLLGAVGDLDWSCVWGRPRTVRDTETARVVWEATIKVGRILGEWMELTITFLVNTGLQS